jgi:prolyl-tRNA editing enzyme YbaK/EbsC (Cys-tRNA(Pro) deacylase)
MPTFRGDGLLDAESIAFAAGSHRRAMRLRPAAYREAAAATAADPAAG